MDREMHHSCIDPVPAVIRKFSSLLSGIIGALGSIASIAVETDRLFDLTLEPGKTITTETFRGVLPIQLFDLRWGMSMKEVDAIHSLRKAKRNTDFRGSKFQISICRASKRFPRASLAEMERKFEMVGAKEGRKALAGAILNNRRWIAEARR